MLLVLVERSQKAHNSPGLTCKKLKKEVHQARLLNYQHYTQQERCGHHGESSWEPISEMFALDTQQVTVICVQVQKIFSFFHTVGFADLNSSDFFLKPDIKCWQICKQSFEEEQSTRKMASSAISFGSEQPLKICKQLSSDSWSTSG